jgi:hypothetical protein
MSLHWSGLQTRYVIYPKNQGSFQFTFPEYVLLIEGPGECIVCQLMIYLSGRLMIYSSGGTQKCIV